MSTSYLLVAGDARIETLLSLAAGTTTTAVVVGPRAVAETVAASGVDAVTWLGEPGDTPLEAYAVAVAGIVGAARPDLVLASARPADRVLAGAAAVALGAPAFTMPTAVAVVDGGVEITRSVFGGIALETDRVAGPAVVVVDGGGLVAGADDAAGAAEIAEVAAAPVGTLTVVETRPATRAEVDLGKAGRIVAVGRGLKSQDDLALAEALAAKLGAELACSRPLAEGLGWFTHDRYVGVTGAHVAPELYVALGISGQLQHTVGARAAGTVVVVNTDGNAPYVKEADYAVVGDLYDVVPALTEAL
ncbi:electron transfer flavoprotein alpha subunit apoprotein [Salana multivorans]|uniref:Electron transfer flavoprotein alpha subunit apoprotein n=1 Tax=Salana multivorans TaxID=120377 RepID=A0A3N2D8A0_9MICO|nr:FAD-binding protein [Salana multivorans]ROR96015.1 electron transfer flavoprotein alpha subunit apoprotein [Salana multivorans]